MSCEEYKIQFPGSDVWSPELIEHSRNLVLQNPNHPLRNQKHFGSANGMFGKKWDPDKISLFREKSSGSNNAMFGKTHSPEIRTKISRNRSGKGVGISGKYVRTLEIRNQISESVTNFYLNEGSVFKCRNFVTGWHHSTKIRQDLFYQSSYERDVLRFLDSDDRVTSFEWKPLKLEYHWKDGSTHRYIPDVKVVIHGFQEEMWEIKSDWELTNDIIQRKLKALQEYCSANGLNFQVIGDSDIDSIRDYLLFLEEGINIWPLQ